MYSTAAGQDNVSLGNTRSNLMSHALSSSTQNAYNTGARAFMGFTTMHNVCKIQALPCCNEELLELFVCHCVKNLKLSYSTIKLYLAGVRSLYVTAGLGNPLCNVQGQIHARLELLLRGVRKSCVSKSMIRKPVTGYAITAICRRLKKGLFGKYLDTLMEAVCLTAFFGFLRCGEFTCSSNQFDPQINLTMLDICFENNKVLINIKASKTDPFRLGYKITLYKNNSDICPVNALMRYFSLRRGLVGNLQEPLFLLPPMQVLTRKTFMDLFHRVCLAANVSCDGLKGHSFRIGAATAAAEAQTPDYLIQTLGRWKSSSYTRYTRISPELLCRTQIQMALEALKQHAIQ